MNINKMWALQDANNMRKRQYRDFINNEYNENIVINSRQKFAVGPDQYIPRPPTIAERGFSIDYDEKINHLAYTMNKTAVASETANFEPLTSVIRGYNIDVSTKNMIMERMNYFRKDITTFFVGNIGQTKINKFMSDFLNFLQLYNQYCKEINRDSSFKRIFKNDVVGLESSINNIISRIDKVVRGETDLLDPVREVLRSVDIHELVKKLKKISILLNEILLEKSTNAYIDNNEIVSYQTIEERRIEEYQESKREEKRQKDIVEKERQEQQRKIMDEQYTENQEIQREQEDRRERERIAREQQEAQRRRIRDQLIARARELRQAQRDHDRKEEGEENEGDDLNGMQGYEKPKETEEKPFLGESQTDDDTGETKGDDQYQTQTKEHNDTPADFEYTGDARLTFDQSRDFNGIFGDVFIQFNDIKKEDVTPMNIEQIIKSIEDNNRIEKNYYDQCISLISTIIAPTEDEKTQLEDAINEEIEIYKDFLLFSHYIQENKKYFKKKDIDFRTLTNVLRPSMFADNFMCRSFLKLLFNKYEEITNLYGDQDTYIKKYIYLLYTEPTEETARRYKLNKGTEEFDDAEDSEKTELINILSRLSTEMYTKTVQADEIKKNKDMTPAEKEEMGKRLLEERRKIENQYEENNKKLKQINKTTEEEAEIQSFRSQYEKHKGDLTADINLLTPTNQKKPRKPPTPKKPRAEGEAKLRELQEKKRADEIEQKKQNLAAKEARLKELEEESKLNRDRYEKKDKAFFGSKTNRDKWSMRPQGSEYLRNTAEQATVKKEIEDLKEQLRKTDPKEP